ncbi:MAG: sensor histidine kinase [Janthinobacterium lividum]
MVNPSEVGFERLLYSGIGFMLLITGAFMSFLLAYQRRMLKQQLRLQQVETKYQQQLLVAAIEAQEGERERIGQDLHDSLGSSLATAKLLVSRLEHLPTAENPTSLLALLGEIMGTMVYDVRSISHSMYPAILNRFGLADAIQHLVDTCNEVGELPVSLQMSYFQSLDLAQELALYRICQELITNSLKHAEGATVLLVRLHQDGSQLVLVVEDNGCGFAPDATGRNLSDGVGLRSLDARVRMLRGKLRNLGEAGQGTHTVIEIPLYDTPH